MICMNFSLELTPILVLCLRIFGMLVIAPVVVLINTYTKRNRKFNTQQ
jgi:hypothetical protein